LFVAREVHEEISFNESLGLWMKEGYIFVLKSVEVAGLALGPEIEGKLFHTMLLSEQFEYLKQGQV
jgi:predicted transcriptional regulator